MANFKKKFLQLIVRLGVVFGATIFAFYFCGWAVIALPQKKSTQWLQYPTPREKAAEIVAAKAWGGGVYVRTTNNSIFHCIEDEQCVEVDEKIVQPLSLCRGLASPDYSFQDPPPHGGKAVDTKVYLFCGADTSEEVNYVILTDGSILKWRHRYGWGPEFAANVASRCGAAAVFALGILAIVWISMGKEEEMSDSSSDKD